MGTESGERPSRITRRALWGGALGWVLFAVAAVFLRGVRWDENYEFAQVLLGIVPYPAGHPLAQYVHSFYSLQTWALAAWMAVVPDALTPNLLRNLLFLLATVLPAFMLTSLLSGRARWGHVAALLMLMGIHVPFYSNYPVQVWPGMYSNGHIGLGWALMALYFLLAGQYRLGYLMAGLMPAVHLGQFPPLFGVAVLRLIWAQRAEDRQELSSALRWGGLGLAVSAGFWGVVRAFTLPPPVDGPYYAALDPEAVFRGYMTYFALHRGVPWGTGQMLIAAALLLAIAMVRRETRSAVLGGPWWWISVYIGLVASLVWGIMAVHLLLGPAIPRVLISWMPYRLINHLSPLLIPMLIAILAARRNTGWILLGAVAFGCVPPALGALLPPEWYTRYLADGAAVYFGLYGAAAAVLAVHIEGDRRFRMLWLGLLAAAWVILARTHQFGALCVFAGAAAGWGMTRFRREVSSRIPLAFCASTLLATLLVQQSLNRQHLPVTPSEQAARAYLAEQNEADAMILVRHQQETLQARLGHPVMTDMATITWIPYKPSLGPSLCKMYRALYGIDFAPSSAAPPGPAWFEVWPAKSVAEWQALAQEYGFRYILAPAFMPLPLPRVVEGDTDHLYRIPE